MARPASATSEAPGKKVRARSRLNSSLLGQGWFEFHRQLEDKLAWNGGWRHTYQKGRTCPVCRWREWCRHAASSRNPPRQLRRSVCPCVGAGGILGLQAGENVKLRDVLAALTGEFKSRDPEDMWSFSVKTAHGSSAG